MRTAFGAVMRADRRQMETNNRIDVGGRDEDDEVNDCDEIEEIQESDDKEDEAAGYRQEKNEEKKISSI